MSRFILISIFVSYIISSCSMFQSGIKVTNDSEEQMAREYTSRDTATYTEILCFYKNMTTHEDNKQLFDSSQYSEIPYFAMYSRDANIVSHSSYLAHLEILDNVNSISANKNDSLSIDVYIYENGKEVNRFYFNSYEQIKEYIRSIKKVLNIHISAERHLK